MQKEEVLSTKQKKRMLFSIAVSLFWVLFMWNFWDRGVYVLGINLSVYFLLLLSFFGFAFKDQKVFAKRNLFWLVPIIMLILSYGIYENTFLKIVNIVVLPMLFTIFFNYSLLEDRQKRHWTLEFFLVLLFGKLFQPLRKISESIGLHAKLIDSKKYKKGTASKIIIGLILFVVVAGLVIIPLLSAADPIFEEKMAGIYGWFKDIISVSLVMKFFVFYFLTVFFGAVYLGWKQHLNFDKDEKGEKKRDSIIAGILLGGVLLLYLLFLWVQFGRLWVGVLPLEFREVELLVKSGFWQLMLLSIINILIFIYYYRKTNKTVQNILSAFTIASLLLLFSAGWRMGLYVVFYGLSYEKFFASYTVLYCTILYLWLMYKVFSQKRVDIIKFLLFLFLWMYAILNIFPLEQFIIRTNVRLARLENSRIDMYESKILSADVLGYIKENKDQGFMKVNNKDDDTVDWSEWITNQEDIVSSKKWYEVNISNIVYNLKYKNN